MAGIRDHHLGSVTFIETINGGAAAVRAVADAVQAEATAANTAGVGFYVAANQEGGGDAGALHALQEREPCGPREAASGHAPGTRISPRT